MSEFLNKRILITGASKGLGKAAAIAFEKKGAKNEYRYMVSGRNKEGN